jgi:pyroglutamyl-peptidase
MKLLITGFEPFNHQTINPTQLIIERLAEHLENNIIIPVLLPTIRYLSTEKLIYSIEKHNPDVVLMLGQAGGIDGFHVERVAINIDDFRIKDNAQNQPIDEPIRVDGEAAYFSTLPIKKITHALQETGFKATLSNSAGTFVCNHLFYGCAHYIKSTKRSILYGFIHVPFETSQTNDNRFSMSIDHMIQAIQVVISSIKYYSDNTNINLEEDFVK